MSKFTDVVLCRARQLAVVWLILQLVWVIGSPACGVRIAPNAMPHAAQAAVHAADEVPSALEIPCDNATEIAPLAPDHSSGVFTLQLDLQPKFALVISRANLGTVFDSVPLFQPTFAAAVDLPPISAL